jgi:hypothetical protein
MTPRSELICIKFCLVSLYMSAEDILWKLLKYLPSDDACYLNSAR